MEKWVVKYMKGNLPTKIQPPLLSIYSSSSINNIVFFLDAVSANSTNRMKPNFSFLSLSLFFFELGSNNTAFFKESLNLIHSFTSVNETFAVSLSITYQLCRFKSLQTRRSHLVIGICIHI